ncbi:hypothetical protein Ato02nite_077820 [Paractinoplanes toevensis]|uniref:Uncharacterized protein n=1 Tax=Paractinoplanes toevensis TaxID=571911 RepID=A0A919W9A6_9ACTN|nr:hypothetical protein Ato02nite_077820 [Actinoplanes toevensis]
MARTCSRRGRAGAQLRRPWPFILREWVNRLIAGRQRIFLALAPGNTGPSRHLTGGGNIGHFFIRESILKRAQMSDVIRDREVGRIYRRPDKWR